MDLNLQEQLIIYGYLPEQLPPFFTTNKLYDNYAELISEIRRPDKGSYDCVDFTIYKSSEARRLLKVPNPIRQLLLIKYVLEKGSELEEIFNANNSSLSNPFYYASQLYEELLFFDLPRLKDEKTSKVKSTFLENLQTKMDNSLGYQFCYKIDIANFYDSIYTHSIEWGIIGRAESKKGRKRDNIGYQLDELIRNTNSRETAGIPTGPFTSRIVSELILNSIDNELDELSAEHNDMFNFTHYVDDYEFYFRSESDIHKIKNKIIEIFNSYRLKINEQKTSIESYPFHNLIDINREYEHYISKYNDKKDDRFIRLLFFKADELTKAGVKGAYKYLYKILDNSKKVNLSQNWAIVEPFLIGHLLVNPSLSQYVVEIVLNYKEHLTDNFQQEVYNNLQLSIENHSHNESHWLLWALLNFDYPFTKEELIHLYHECDDDFTKIMLIHIIYKNGFEELNHINELLNNEVQKLKELSFESEHWLLIHEWHINEWHNYKEFQNMYNGNIFFQKMKQLKVSFIDF